MDRTVEEYLRRGGSKAAIARAWGEYEGKPISRSHAGRKIDNPYGESEIADLIQDYSGARVEFNPRNPQEVFRFYVPGQKVTFAEYTFFDLREKER